MGLHCQAGRIGTIAAPFILMLGAQLASSSRPADFLPYMFYGCTSLLASLLLIMMPETLGAPLPESMEVRSSKKILKCTFKSYCITV